MPLTDAALRLLKPKDKRYMKVDQRGLYIEVEPNRSKLWRYKYIFRGKEKRFSLGRYPGGSLAAARQSKRTRDGCLVKGLILLPSVNASS